MFILTQCFYKGYSILAIARQRDPHDLKQQAILEMTNYEIEPNTFTCDIECCLSI